MYLSESHPRFSANLQNLFVYFLGHSKWVIRHCINITKAITWFSFKKKNLFCNYNNKGRIIFTCRWSCGSRSRSSGSWITTDWPVIFTQWLPLGSRHAHHTKHLVKCGIFNWQVSLIAVYCAPTRGVQKNVHVAHFWVFDLGRGVFGVKIIPRTMEENGIVGRFTKFWENGPCFFF